MVFGGLPGGDLLAALFFLALGLVAFLSAVAAIEALVAAVASRPGWTRRRAIWTLVAVEAALGIPSMISMEYLAGSDLVWGSTMQPFGSLMALVAVAWSLERGRALKAAGLSGSRLGRIWIFWIRYVVPLAVLIALISGWLGG